MKQYILFSQCTLFICISGVLSAQLRQISFINHDPMPAKVTINTGLNRVTSTLNRTNGRVTFTVPGSAQVTIRGAGIGKQSYLAKDLSSCTEINSTKHPAQRGVLMLSVKKSPQNTCSN